MCNDINNRKGDQLHEYASAGRAPAQDAADPAGHARARFHPHRGHDDSSP